MRPTCKAIMAVLTVAAAPASHAANPEAFDILGLRLGMAEPRVDAVLLQQGVPSSRISRSGGGCEDQRRCSVTITAPTRDGALTVRLIGSGPAPVFEVTQIAYSFKGIAPGEPAMIRTSLLQRFGPPDQAMPMMWCRRVWNGRCQADQASLGFVPDTLTLTLMAGPTPALAK